MFLEDVIGRGIAEGVVADPIRPQDPAADRRELAGIGHADPIPYTLADQHTCAHIYTQLGCYGPGVLANTYTSNTDGF